MELVKFEKHANVGILTIVRPEALNALNQETLYAILHVLHEEASPENIRALILTGEGDKAFIAGADIKEMLPMDHLGMKAFCELGQSVALMLEQAPYLTLAAVNGYALGGGLEMALACDFIYASENAKLGLPEVSLGIIPGFGGTQRLSRAVGTRRAKELILSGKMINATVAHQIGLVNHVVEKEKLLSECLLTAQTVASQPPFAVMQAKAAINCGSSMGLLEALELEKNMCAVAFATPERKEKMSAFVNKKK